MASIPSIPSHGSLSTAPIQLAQPHAAPAKAEVSADPVPDAVVASDQALVFSGLEALSRVATTPLWSADFELPAAPPPPPVTKKPWDYASTPDITVNYARGATSAPTDPMTGGPGATWRWPGLAAVEPEEEDFSLFEFVAFPFQLLAEGVQAGGEAVFGVVDAVGQTVAKGTQMVAGAIESGLQQAVGAVGDFAANAWKSITSFRLW